MARVRIKICGMRSLDEAVMAVAAGADALGFVFASSPRRIDPETAHGICKMLPPFVSRVGVFVNEERYQVMEIASLCRLDVLQFHGEEPPGYCRGFSQMVVKALAVRDTEALATVAEFAPVVDAVLLDACVDARRGGTGQVCDWELAGRARGLVKNLILAGGLRPENVREALRQVRPFAVDVSSGVERDGKKDPQLMQTFIDEVRRFELTGC